jgi:hypothetical protein
MVLDGFGSVISLVWVFHSSLLVSSFVLYGTTTLVFCGVITLILCGAPPSVAIFSLNWLVWSVVRFWVKLW